MATRPFNPDRPCVIGQQWQLDVGTLMPLDSANAMGMVLKAATSDTIGTIWTAVQEMLGGNSAIAVEIYDVTSGSSWAIPTLPSVGTTTYLPSGDLSGYPVGVTGYDGVVFAGPPYWPYVNSTTRTPGTFLGQRVGQNRFILSSSGRNFGAAFQFAGVSGSLSGDWITKVRGRLQVSNLYFGGGTAGALSVGVIPYIVVNGVLYPGSPQSVSQTTPGTSVVVDFFENPATGLPWTPADINNFDAGSGQQWGVGCTGLGVGNTSSYLVVEEVQLQVDYSSTDLRLAIGVGAPLDAGSNTLGHQGWVPMALVNPNTGASSSVTLVAGHYYMILMKSTNSSFVALNRQFQRYDSVTTQPTQFGPPTWIPINVALSSQTRRPLQSFSNTGVACILEKTSTAISTDSQPYVFVTPPQGRQVGWTTLPNGLFHMSEISSGQSLRQQFTVDTNTTFGYMQVVTSLLTTTTQNPNLLLAGFNPPLKITIKRQSDDAIFGGPYFVQTTDLSAPVTAWQQVGIDIGALTLPAGQYYWLVESDAVPEVAWQVQVAITNTSTGGTGAPTGPPAGTYVSTWGVGTDLLVVYFNGSPTTYTGSAALLFVATRPPTLTGFSATHLGESACHVDGIRLTWSVPTLSCGEHGYYDLERSDDGGVTWNQIANITTLSANYFIDYESIRNSVAEYRVREVRADGAPGLWSSTATATALFTGVGYLFVSNEQPNLNVFYPDINGARVFSYPQDVSVLQPYGQDYQIVLHDLEYRGITFQTQLAIRAECRGCLPEFTTCDSTTLTGTDVFNPLQSISRADLSYVCIHDEHGDRYFSNVVAGPGTWMPLGKEIFYQNISVTEVTNVPSTPDVTPAS